MPDLAIRGAFAPLPDGRFNLMVRDGPGRDWRELLIVPADDAITTDVITFSEDGTSCS